jgi:hypothetical protein
MAVDGLDVLVMSEGAGGSRRTEEGGGEDDGSNGGSSDARQFSTGRRWSINFESNPLSTTYARLESRPHL